VAAIHGVVKGRTATLEVDAGLIQVRGDNGRVFGKISYDIAIDDLRSVDLITQRARGLALISIVLVPLAWVVYDLFGAGHLAFQVFGIAVSALAGTFVVFRPPRCLRIATASSTIEFDVAHESLADARAFVATRGRVATALPTAEVVDRSAPPYGGAARRARVPTRDR
jgi:hypothetical protein